MSDAFAERQWRKKHRYVVEQCKVLSVADYLIGYRAQKARGLSADERAELLAYQKRTLAILPKVRIARRAAGCLQRWYIVCPCCGRDCQYIFLPPPTCPKRREWTCRKCIAGEGAVYASQRYSHRHLLRRIPTPRKSRSYSLHGVGPALQSSDGTRFPLDWWLRKVSPRRYRAGVPGLRYTPLEFAVPQVLEDIKRLKQLQGWMRDTGA